MLSRLLKNIEFSSFNTSYFSSTSLKMTDPCSLVMGTIGVIGVGTQAFKSTYSFIDSYRCAGKEVSHIHFQGEAILSYLEDDCLILNEQLAFIHSSFLAIEKEFPHNLHANTTWTRLCWANGHKSKVAKLIAQMKQTETSAILLLVLQQS
jgi:hypothetical protein